MMYMTIKSHSIAYARAQLPELVRACERGPVELSRYGQPVAMLVSIEEYQRLAPARDLGQAIIRYLDGRAPDTMGDEVWDDVRDKSAGRPAPF